MSSYLSEFNKAAQKLSRNPLGIIALFIVLVYGIAALVLGVSSNNLEPGEKVPLVYFLVCFPIVVLIVFYRLVSKHHVKLYAPHDFQDKEGFFRALSPHEQRQKLNEEIKAIEEIARPEKELRSTKMDRSRNLTAKLTRHEYFLAEQLALREIETEFKVPVRRQVAVGKDHGVDGVFDHRGKPFFIEIKYTKKPQHIRMLIQRELYRFLKIGHSMKHKPSFLLAIVIDGFDNANKNHEAKKLIEAAEYEVKIRFFDFDELKEKYGFS